LRGNVTVGGCVFVAVKYISLMCDWYVGVVVGCISVDVVLLRTAVILIRVCISVDVVLLRAVVILICGCLFVGITALSEVPVGM